MDKDEYRIIRKWLSKKRDRDLDVVKKCVSSEETRHLQIQFMKQILDRADQYEKIIDSLDIQMDLEKNNGFGEK